MKILITGGHFSPAHALISEFKERGHEVIVVGRKHPFEGDMSESFEYRVSKKENIPFYEIKTGRYQRKFSTYTIISLLKTPSGFVSALSLIEKIQPNVVLTFGGYIGLPIAYAAALKKIPVVLHEQTQKAGLASRAISKIAKKICISHESSAKFFPQKRTLFTGNPLRKDIFIVNKKIDIPNGFPVIYITGGSAGSHFINELMQKIGLQLLNKYILIHQTGDSIRFNDYENLIKLKQALPENLRERYIVRKFIEPSEIGFVLKESDLLISRAGANIVDELKALQKHALLIPLPWGQHSEQLENAKYLKKLGLGEFIEEDKVNEVTFLEKIDKLIMTSKNHVSDESHRKISQDAASKIADVVEEVAAHVKKRPKTQI